MVRYQIKYVLNNDICIDYIEAPDLHTALVIFYTQYRYDDVVEVKEVV